MSKIDLVPVTGAQNISAINDNFAKVAEALNDKALYRDNPAGQPNLMKNDLDMNGKRIYNLPVPVADNEAARLGDLKDAVVGGQYMRTVRSGDTPLNQLPDAAGRANRLLSFDESGQPQLLFPSNDSATQLRIDLANQNGSDLIGFQQQGGALQTVEEKLTRVVHLEDFGGKGDGISDDSNSLSAAQAFLDKGGQIIGLPGKVYRFPLGFTLNKGISLIGSWVTREDLPNHNPISASSCLLVGGSVSIQVGNGSECSKWLVWRDGLTIPTNEAEAISRVAGFSGTAISAISSDAKVRNNTIIGFNQAIESTGVERAIIEDNQFDCTNGIVVSQSFDITHVKRNHGWPFLTVHRPWTTGPLLQRNGVAYKIFNVADFIHVVENFAYGYMTSYYFSDLAAASILANKGDNVIASSSGRIGIETRGVLNNVVFDNNHVDSHEVNYRFAHTNGCVTGGTNTSGQSSSLSIQCGPTSSASFNCFSVAGPCNYVIDFLSGVGKWHIGSMLINSSTSSGVAYNYVTDDLSNISIGWTTIFGVGTIDNYGYGSTEHPSIRASHDSNSGIFENPLDGTLGVSVNSKPSAVFSPVTDAVNFLSFIQSSTGNSVKIAADGSDSDITISLLPKGNGFVQLGSPHSSATLTPTGYVTIYDGNGVPRRFLTG